MKAVIADGRQTQNLQCTKAGCRPGFLIYGSRVAPKLPKCTPHPILSAKDAAEGPGVTYWDLNPHCFVVRLAYWRLDVKPIMVSDTRW